MYINEYGKLLKQRPVSFYVTNHTSSEWSLDKEEERFQKIFSIVLDLIPAKYFGNIDNYFLALNISPSWLISAGLSPESGLSRVEFENLLRKITKDNAELFYKILYTEDIRDRVNYLQNKISDIKHLTILFYKQFSEIPFKSPDSWDNKNTTIFVTGTEFDLPFTMLESIFQKMYTALDLCVKLVCSLEFKPIDYTKYHKINFHNIMWIDRKKYNKKYDFSSLENYKYYSLLESLRNDFTHNGSWEACRRIYLKLENGKIVNHWISFNEHEEGIPVKSINRNRFYPTEEEIHINILLPSIIEDYLISMSEFLEKLSLTIHST
jgi:hypothetical protein